ncbi:MAG: cation:proton antiporter [Pseudolabrys sp.]
MTLALGLASGFIKNRLWLSEAAIALLLGVLIGPACLGLFNLDPVQPADGFIVREAARVSLAIAIMAAGTRLPSGYLRAHAGELLVVLVAGMSGMWLMTSLVTAVMLQSSLLVTVLVAACVTPTDPVLAASILTGADAERRIPARLRNILSAESGANDGLGMIFVLLPVSFLTQRGPDAALSAWAWRGVLVDLTASVFLGAAFGYLAAWLYRAVQGTLFAERASIVTVNVSLALFTVAAIGLIGGDGLLGVFAAAVVFATRTDEQRTEASERFQEAVKRFFELPVLVLLGVALPWGAWSNLGWLALAYPLVAIVLRRLPVWLVLARFMPSLTDTRDRWFAGWFGPVGISGLFYVLLAMRETGHAAPWIYGSMIMLASVLLHGIAATPLTRFYAPKPDKEIRVVPGR